MYAVTLPTGVRKLADRVRRPILLLIATSVFAAAAGGLHRAHSEPLDPDNAGASESLVTAFRNCMTSNAILAWSELQQRTNMGYDNIYPLLISCNMLAVFEYHCMKAGHDRASCDDAASELAKQAITIAGMQCGRTIVCN
ncbi:hypothetical protein [Segnochrobactrum spirostomi]|uniref:Uncharacterized protein n=1 Tax=Segnochrobactrum spirostomi TaxID=2608987 RepID=A0A6A7XXQ8_9HYPH|nr:hypothetical protein [Segnochrobactrum spirostomi]MQT11108.1 hypothetical protein [Segnochrobactrum spirostomi]